MPFELQRVTGTVAGAARPLRRSGGRPRSRPVWLTPTSPLTGRWCSAAGSPKTIVDREACAAAGVAGGAPPQRRRCGPGRAGRLWSGSTWSSRARDPLWCADVGHAAWWVGEAWAAALRRTRGRCRRGVERADAAAGMVGAGVFRRPGRRRGDRRLAGARWWASRSGAPAMGPCSSALACCAGSRPSS